MTRLPDALLPPLGQALELATLDDFESRMPQADPDWLGQPAPAHQLLHELCPVPAVINAFRKMLSQPVQQGVYRGGRYATALGAYLFHLDENGTLLTWRWSARGPVPISEHEVGLARIVSQPDWLEQNASLLGSRLFEVSRQRPAHPGFDLPVPPTARAYGQLLINAIARRFLTLPVIETTQQALQHALCLRNDQLTLAGSLPARTSGCQGASVGDYNLMVASGREIHQIRQDSPQVADLYPLFCDAPDFEQTLEPAAALRQFLLMNGADQASWRSVCAMGSTSLEPFLSLYDAPRDKAMLDLLNCLRALRVREATQLWALAHLFSTFGAHGSRPMQYLKSIDCDPTLVHILSCSPRRLTPNPQDLDELDLVIRWAMDEHIAQLDKRQRQAGWPWLLKQARQWQKREQFRLKASKQRWQAPITAVSIDQLTFEALLTELSLWDEALALRHCADVYGHRCRDGAYLIYSVRLPATLASAQADKRLATLALSRLGPKWRLDQLVGPANTGVSDAIEQAALTLIKLLNTQTDAVFVGVRKGRLGPDGAPTDPYVR
ncbi:MAG: hypothetical protein AB8C46_12325 [Burkholderiaceae bacterium]